MRWIRYCCNYLTDNKVATINSATEYVKITRTVTHGHSLHLSSNCAYVFKWNIFWVVRDIDSEGKETRTTIAYGGNNAKRTSGWGDTIQIPANAVSIHVRCDDYWWFSSTRCVCDVEVELRNHINVHVTGTTLGPGHTITYSD